MNKKSKRFFKQGIVSIVVAVMMLTTIMPVWAQETQVPDFSLWATGMLNEAERYGIYPMDWYFEGFRDQISQERLEYLLTATDNKLALLGLELREDFVPIPSEGDGSRGDVVTKLYNTLAKYELSVGDNPVDYMQQRGILKGTNNGLELGQSCTTEQAIVFATRLIEDTYNMLDKGSLGLAWKVEHNGNTMYFLGSIHVGSSDVYPMNKRLKEAFNESDALIVEANLFDQQGGMEYFLEKATYQDGTIIKDHISEETYEKLLKVLEIYGLPADTFNLYKPWSVANDLTVISMSNSEDLQQGAQAASLGIDIYFLSKAMLAQKPIIELEGMKFQGDLFDGLSAEYQESYLDSAIENILNPPAEEEVDTAELLDEWLNYWMAGDIDGFDTSYSGSTEESDDEFSNMIFGERDQHMAEEIIKILESEEKGTYFVVVGAGHFVMDNTIIDILTEKGYNVQVLSE